MIRLWILAGAFCVMQVSILRGIAIAQITPDIVLVIVIYNALFHERAGMWFGFVTGIFIDLYSSSPGYNALMGTIIGYGIGRLSLRVYKEVPLLWIILLFISSLVQGTVIFAGTHQLSSYFFWRYILFGALYTTVIGLMIFYVLRKSDVRRIPEM